MHSKYDNYMEVNGDLHVPSALTHGTDSVRGWRTKEIWWQSNKFLPVAGIKSWSSSPQSRT